MSDDISKIPAQDMTSTDSDTEENGTSNSPQVFDITPDLNIAPAKDDVENPTPPINIPDIIKPLPPKPVITENEIKKEQKNENATQYGPANPPAKTIGSIGNASATKTAEAKALNLQEAILKDTEINPIKPKVPVNDPNIKTIRTYERDFAEAIAKKRVSAASMIIAEENKKREISNTTETNTKSQNTLPIPIKKKTSIKNWLLSIISIILICGGIFSAYYLYTKSPIAPSNNKVQNQNTQINTIPSIILSDTKTTIDTDSINKKEILSKIQSEIQKQYNEDSIHEIMLVKKSANEKLKSKITINEALELSSISVPDIFNRSLNPDWMLGIYSGKNNQNNLFLITKNDFFQNAFAGIIQLEKSLPEQLKPHLFKKDMISQIQATSSAEVSLKGQYKDRIIKNKDVREYVADNGHIVFLYSFISNDKLVITDSEEALLEIISRLEKNSFVR